MCTFDKEKGLSTLNIWMFSTCKINFDLHQNLRIETLQVMEPILEKYWQSKLLCSLCDFQRYKNKSLNCHVHPLGGSFDYILTLDGNMDLHGCHVQDCHGA